MVAARLVLARNDVILRSATQKPAFVSLSAAAVFAAERRVSNSVREILRRHQRWRTLGLTMARSE